MDIAIAMVLVAASAWDDGSASGNPVVTVEYETKISTVTVLKTALEAEWKTMLTANSKEDPDKYRSPMKEDCWQSDVKKLCRTKMVSEPSG